MNETTLYYLEMFVPLILLFGFMWFFLIRPQRKKDNEARRMRSQLQPGDEIVTIGGVVGKVLNVKEESIVIYCGSDKTKMEFKKWAVAEVTAKSEAPQKEAEVVETAAEEAEAAPKKKAKRLTLKEEAEEK
ncbi:MAG: preprotein translocase subunit YajC [Clostridia bacterium]|nr:preprotein translocase subunit YajC [Clostridia bacterium]